MDKAFVATKVARSTVPNDKWNEVLACDFEDDEGKHRVVYLIKAVAALLGIPKESWPLSMRTAGQQKLEE
jgi:hypothetical protein